MEACKAHMELGICLGQQKKLKEIINWLKKKKKRSIRKDELIAMLIGKQYPAQNQMFNLTGGQMNQTSGLFGVQSVHPQSNRRQPPIPQQQQQQQQQQTLFQPQQNSTRLLPQLNNQQRNSLNSSNSQTNSPANNTNSADNVGNNSVEAADTNSDLATFREALIMHSMPFFLILTAHNQNLIFFSILNSKLSFFFTIF